MLHFFGRSNDDLTPEFESHVRSKCIIQTLSLKSYLGRLTIAASPSFRLHPYAAKR